ncbi:filamentous hemagglutinin N-terminal domain-containing protein [Variovorax sp. GB1P17]|uniref:two-partner secretion domain-containing protein n=1 Tax=Variovorax sp. GB1P17 TaxID=3443740 RepID=UPI003F46163B
MKQRNLSRQRPLHGLALRPLALSLVCAGLGPAMADVTMPGGFTTPMNSGVTMSQIGALMTINQQFQRGIANWQTFSIGAGGTVNIVQPSTRAVLLNRVVGDGFTIQASRIDGTLKTSLLGSPGLPGGSVFLINPSGIVFGSGSSVNVGGLVASTLKIDDSNFIPAGMQDRPLGKGDQFVFMGPANSVAQVKVESGATIIASPGGTVALVGGSVRNEGNIDVARGSVGLVSASKLTMNLDFDGDGLTTFTVPVDGRTTFKLADLQASDPTATAQLMNVGSIDKSNNNKQWGVVSADGGRVVLMAAAADVDARHLVVSQTGVIQARSLSSRNGEIVLDAGQSKARSNEMLLGGKLDASGTDAGVAGGSITAQADYVRLTGTADAGGSQGGKIQVTGVNAVSMSPDAVWSANATGANGVNGAGGTVGLSADFVHVSGQLQARGAGSGAGGTITTSARQLEISNAARIDAAGGATGANGVWVADAIGTLNVDSTTPAYDPSSYAQNTADTRVSTGAIGYALGHATDVTLRNSAPPNDGRAPDVVFEDGTRIVKSEGRDARLTVDSLRNIRMLSGSSIQSNAGALHVDFDANADKGEAGGAIVLSGANIATNGGNIRFYGQRDAVAGYAVGGTADSDGGPQVALAGVTLSDSHLSTCAMASGSCGGTGAISLRGQGTSSSASGDPAYYVSAGGVLIAGGSLTTGAGNIAITGQGAIGAAGVEMRATDSGGTALSTGTGDVSVVGSSRNWTASDPAAVYASEVTPNDSVGAPTVVTGLNTGVSLTGTVIVAGERVGIDGTGGNLQDLSADAGFVRAASLANNGNGVSYGSGDGVAIFGGNIVAGKGQQVSVAGTAGGKSFQVNGQGAVVPGASDPSAVTISVGGDGGIRAEGGRIAIDGRGGDVSVTRGFGNSDFPLPVSTAMLDVSSGTGAGGTVAITGRNVLVDDVYTVPTIDASGASKAGTIDINATNVIAIGAQAGLAANASSATGDGGSVRVIAGDTLRAFGSLSARGGSAGGNGGFIETSAPHFDLSGLRVDASAPVGAAGTWLIDPFDVTIAHGNGPGSLPTNPFVPVMNSTIQDGDINAALDKGTSVTITTGTAGTSPGNINFDSGVVVERTVGTTPVTFRLDANNGIGQNPPPCPSFPCSPFVPTVIRSTTGPLDVVFNAKGVGGGFGNGIVYSGQILTDGGNVTMNADATSTGNRAIQLNNTTIDTRITALGDAGPGGFVQITGKRGVPTFSTTGATVEFNGVNIQSSTGNVAISGIGVQGPGVRIADGTARSQILTTSGDIQIVGVGSAPTTSFGTTTVQSVELNDALVRSVDGNIAIRGLATAGPAGDTSGGVLIANNALVTTLGVGSIDIAGESQSGGAGVTIAPTARVDGNRNVVLRASNGGAVDALVIGGTVRAGNVLDLRPGGVDATGNAVDRTANPITLGGTAATGFAVSADEFTRLNASTIVAGSNAHAADINVVGPLSLSSALTLENGGGGNINLGGAVTVPKLGLLSRGNITQAANAPITATTLMARSTGGSVLLDQAPNNVSAATVGGGAAGAFRYVDVDTVQLGSVSVVGFDAAGNAPQVEAATSMAADTVFVRTLTGDLLLGTNVSSTNGTDLVAASRFQNLGAYTIGGAPWRVWADTWVGETRGGLLGSGLYPNLYHCAYSGLCSVNIPAGANHFIYAQQPTATVVIGNVSRPFGYPNPLFSYGIGGLILGDTGAGFFGIVGSPAVQSSPQGVYPINGVFTSAEGYAVNVVPGNLLVAGLPNLPRPDVLRDLPSTWLYDRNIGPPPICFATGPLEGDRAAQGGDVLAREWSRVRSRPNLSSCVDTEKRNGCSDF